MYALILALAWTNDAPILNVDGHDVYLRTSQATVTIHGFASAADCEAYNTTTLPQILASGVPVDYQITHRRCHRE